MCTRLLASDRMGECGGSTGGTHSRTTVHATCPRTLHKHRSTNSCTNLSDVCRHCLKLLRRSCLLSACFRTLGFCTI